MGGEDYEEADMEVEALRILGLALQPCVHVAGVLGFLRLAEEQGHVTTFLGPAVGMGELVGAIMEDNPDLVAIGYRLSPETARPLFEQLRGALQEAGLAGIPLAFGGTPPVARVARETGLFGAVFSGEEPIEEILAYLQGREVQEIVEAYPQRLSERMRGKAPFPLIRHHFGLPSLSATLQGIAEIAQAKVLDILSLGPDQNFQESFFRPQEMDQGQEGAGGVPIRSREDLLALKEASRRGNYPLMRCYSGTRDVFAMAELLVETIENAWTAIPLSWYNQLDGRGPRSVQESMAEAQKLMAWHAQRGIPVEVNEAHHWSLREAPDVICVAAAFLAAYNAKKMGVKEYICQIMLNTPPTLSPQMDLAKALAQKDLVWELAGLDFQPLLQVRAGLSSFPPDPGAAKGQLAYATLLGMALRPEIVHVVAFSEADHAASPSDVIESCRLVRQILTRGLEGMPDMSLDPMVMAYRQELVSEARVLLEAIAGLGSPDPWGSPDILARAIALGLLDAPHLRPTSFSRGGIQTRTIAGACRAVVGGRPVSEKERIAGVLS